MEEKVILVDEQDQAIGEMEKLQAHEQALLHRAFSIFIFNERGQLMLQQRQLTKYHSGGLWTNTCCGHPRPNETTKEAAQRRLQEEMGFLCDLNHKFYFTYKAALDNNLTEYELDHVFFGQFDAIPVLNPDEAADWNWVEWTDLCDDIQNNPDSYTFWLKICVEKINDLKLIK
jgi:isopentenyl-diphosphate delta-isomerase